MPPTAYMVRKQRAWALLKNYLATTGRTPSEVGQTWNNGNETTYMTMMPARPLPATIQTPPVLRQATQPSPVRREFSHYILTIPSYTFRYAKNTPDAEWKYITRLSNSIRLNSLRYTEETVRDIITQEESKEDYYAIEITNIVMPPHNTRPLRIYNNVDLKTAPMYDEILTYEGMKKRKIPQPEKMCAYTIVAENTRLSFDDIEQIVGKRREYGLTPLDMAKIYERERRPMLIVDMAYETVIHTSIALADRRCHKPDVYITSNNHLYVPDKLARKTILKKVKGSSNTILSEDVKQSQKDDDDEKPELQEIKVNTFNEAIALIDELADLDIGTKYTILIRDGGDTLNAEYINLIQTLKTVYRFSSGSRTGDVKTLHPRKNISIRCGNFNMEREAAIYFNIDFNYQDATALASILMKNIKQENINTKRAWERTAPNAEVKKLIEEGRTRYGGLTWEKPALYVQGSTVHVCDFYRHYTSIAMKARFFVIDYMAEVKPYDGKPTNENVYYVETTDISLFAGNGVYVYDMVAFGLEQKLINVSDIKYQVAIRYVPQNDKMVREFIDTVYRAPINDVLKKEMVNSFIGQLASRKKMGGQVNHITTNEMEVSYFLNKTGTLKNRSEKVSVMCHINETPVYMVNARHEATRATHDNLMNMLIVQSGRLASYRLAQKINRTIPTAVILGINTDAITYCVSENIKPYPTSKKPDFGDVREQRFHKLREMATKQPRAQKYELPPQEWKSTDTEGITPATLATYNRAFISGAGGSGKSHTLRALEKYLIDIGRSPIVMAYTHTAANNIGGQTFHRALWMDTNFAHNEQKFRDVQNSITDILADECSMFGANLLKIIGMMPPHINVYCFGHFFQLPPVENGSHNYEDSQAFKTLCGYNRINLTKCWRSDPTFSMQALAFYEGKEHKIPDGVNNIQRSEWRPEPIINIFARNLPRKMANREIVCEMAMEKQATPTPDSDRVVIKETETVGEWAWEEFDARKLAHMCRNQHIWGKQVICPPKPGKATQENPLLIAHKYLVNSVHVNGDIWKHKTFYNRSAMGMKHGRMFAESGQSLQSMGKKVKGVIAQGLYTDVDMANAHPCILKHLCRIYEISSPMLNHYVDSREIVISEFMGQYKCDRSTAKKTILAAINGGEADYRQLAKHHGASMFMEAFILEMRAVSKVISELFPERFVIRKNMRIKGGKDWNHTSSFMNSVLCDFENNILQTMIDKMKTDGKIQNTYVRCFDGILIPSGRVDRQYLDNLEAHITATLDIVMKLEIKPEDTPLQLPAKMGEYTGPTVYERRWVNESGIDQFPFLFTGLKVIATVNKKTYKNGQYFQVMELKGDSVIIAPIPTIPLSLKDIEAEPEDCITIPKKIFRKDFEPGYCITSYKAQCRDIAGKYYIHEWNTMLKNIKGKEQYNEAYVALSRTTKAENIYIVSNKDKYEKGW